MLNRIQYGGSPAWYRHTPFRASPTFFVIILSPIMPIATQAEELRNESSHPLGHRIPDELQLLQEEPVSIAGYSEQPLQQAPAHVYVTTDKDIRDFFTTDLPTVVRHGPGIEAMQVTGAAFNFNVSMRGDNHSHPKKFPVMVDGRSIYIDMHGQLS